METEAPARLPFYETPHPFLSKMAKKEMEDELKQWRNLWSWVDMEVKGWLIKVGHTYKFTRRDYKIYFGTLGKTHWELKQLELDCVVEDKDYVHRTLTTEVVTMTVPIGQLINWEEVHERDIIILNDRMELPGEATEEDKVSELV